MQSINLVILNPIFFITFFGTAAICVLSIVTAITLWPLPGSEYLFVGGVRYLIGGLLVTAVVNVPRGQRVGRGNTR
jgi:uncharacterized membrane protein